MPKRGEPTKEISISPEQYEKFRSFNPEGFHLTNPDLLNYIMNLADKELSRNNQPRSKGKFLPAIKQGGLENA
jgi:hypothetical protein